VTLALVVLGAVPLTVYLQGRWSDVPWVAAGALVAFGSRELTKLGWPPDGSAFLATFALGAVAMIQRSFGGRLPAVLIIPGFLQIAPGFLGTEAVLALLRPGAAAGDSTFFHVLLQAMQLVAGLAVAEAVFRGRSDASRGAPQPPPADRRPPRPSSSDARAPSRAPRRC
jgi:uncharacterized membrane protein YjjB (DUF3815 family)